LRVIEPDAEFLNVFASKAHGEALSAIVGKDEQRALDLMRRLLFDVAKEVARAKTLPPVSRASPGARTRKGRGA
jgi:hypothetical protein